MARILSAKRSRGFGNRTAAPIALASKAAAQPPFDVIELPERGTRATGATSWPDTFRVYAPLPPELSATPV